MNKNSLWFAYDHNLKVKNLRLGLQAIWSHYILTSSMNILWLITPTLWYPFMYTLIFKQEH